MKDNQFDDIGKRLHDMEANPPTDGWNKISSDLSGGNKPGGNIWLSKNWWKPLILVIPAMLYLPFSEIGINPSTLSSSLSSSTSEEQRLTNEKENPTSSETNELNTSNLITEAHIGNSAPGNEVIVSAKVTSKKKDQKVDDHEKRNAIHQQNDHELMMASHEAQCNELNKELSAIVVADHSDTAALISVDQRITLADAPRNETLTDTLKLSSSEENQTQKATGSWRINFAFTPQVITNTAKPLTNDELFITEINQAANTKPYGYGLALGVGKSITPHFYMDGQLSYYFIQRNIQYQFSDGTIDTLLTVEQPDKSYRVSPVYAIENREISGKYHYGGARLAATYYFWTTQHSRFNLTASLGVHYLLSSTVKEKINDEWITISNGSNNTMNYSFSAGAGYNIMMGRGWELMINPVLTWQLREIKSREVPYSLREEALGLNFMLSKTLGNR